MDARLLREKIAWCIHGGMARQGKREEKEGGKRRAACSMTGKRRAYCIGEEMGTSLLQWHHAERRTT